MFARLLGHSGQTTSRLFGGKPRRVPKPTPAANNGTLSGQQLEHLLTYWSAGVHKPTTATVKGGLYIDHLGVRISTDAEIEKNLRAVLGNDSLFSVALQAVVTHTGTLTLEALRNARPSPTHIPADGRYGVGLKAFGIEMDEVLSRPCDTGMQKLMDAIGAPKIKELAEAALQTVSHEALLADQLRETAQSIRRMEQQMVEQSLPPEDIYELKLRRDLFISDIQLYSRITRAAVEQVAGKNMACARPASRHYVLSMIFTPCARAGRQILDVLMPTGRETPH